MGKLGPTLALFILSAIAVACSTTARAPGQTTTTLPAAGDRQVVVTEPSAGARSPVVITEPSARGQVAAQPSAAVGGQVNHKVTGRVTDINRNSGQITIRTPEGGSLKLVLPPLAVASVREGDDVAVDVLVNPARR
jgi:hypothetical protein